MFKFLFTFGLIILGLSLGYLIQRTLRERIIQLPISLDQLRRILLKTALLFINPITVIGAIWVIELNDPRIVTLPFLGMGAIFLGGLLALWFSKLLQLERKQTGSLFTCGAFTNLGTMGGLVCYIFLGEIGFGLVYIYRLFEEFIYYTVGFPIAKLYGSASVEREDFLNQLRKLASDAFLAFACPRLFLRIEKTGIIPNG